MERALRMMVQTLTCLIISDRDVEIYAATDSFFVNLDSEMQENSDAKAHAGEQALSTEDMTGEQALSTEI